MLNKILPKTIIKKLKNQEGFSLTEMVVVIAIIMVLVSNLVPYVKVYLRKAYKVSDMQEARLIGQTAQLLLYENKDAYNSWMACYNKALTQRKGNFETGQTTTNTGSRGNNRGDYTYIEDDFTTTPLCPMYRSHFNTTDERRRLFNCVDSGSEASDARLYADILHEEMPLVDIQKTNNRSTFLMANFGCRKKNEYGAYMRTTSSTTAHQNQKYLYGDSYVITARVDDPMFVEVYVSASNAASASYPLYRLYPDVSQTYLALQ